MNAFERGDELVVDLVAYDDASIIDSLYLDERGPVAEIPPSELRRYVIGLDTGTVGYEALTDHTVELPRIDYARRNTREYSYAYFAGGGAGSTWLDRLVKVDVGRGEVAAWHEDGCYPGEPIFVRAPGRARPRTAASSSRWCSTPAPGARSCSCSTPARSASWRAPRRRTTSRSASTASTCDE